MFNKKIAKERAHYVLGNKNKNEFRLRIKNDADRRQWNHTFNALKENINIDIYIISKNFLPKYDNFFPGNKKVINTKYDSQAKSI